MNRIWVLICFVYVLLVASSCRHADASMPQKMWSQDPHFMWVGTISVPVSSLYITINGVSTDAALLMAFNHSGATHIRLSLSLGKSNLIVIQAGSTIVYTADVFYAPEYYATLVPPEYQFSPFHTEANEKSCRACHRLTVTTSDITPSKPSESICFPCHQNEFPDLKFQHKEAGTSWECLKCHQAEALETDYTVDGPARFAINESSRVALLCYTCHTESEKHYSEYKFVHGPVAISKCSVCHNPHGSSRKYMLQKESSALCIECHGKEDMMKKAVIHKPVIDAGCTGCHSPHGDNYPYFLSSEVKDLCLKCHPKTDRQKNNHPVNGHPVTGAKDPLNPGQPLSCASCHDPHSSTFRKLLPVDEVMMICMRCHSIGR